MSNTKYAPCLDRAQMEHLARLLGEEVTGSKLPLLLEQVYLHDRPELSTKWKEYITHLLYTKMRSNARTRL